MEYIFLVLCLAITVIAIAVSNSQKPKNRYDSKGFDSNRIHKNGTKFDDFGYDYFGYDKNGYNADGYNRLGKNQKGQYNRLSDTKSGEEEGFYNLILNPIRVSDHARERMTERLGIKTYDKMNIMAFDAYRYGKSKRQIKKTSAYFVEEIEQRHNNSVVLIYKNVIYIFSYDNTLKTVYKNDKIPL